MDTRSDLDSETRLVLDRLRTEVSESKGAWCLFKNQLETTDSLNLRFAKALTGENHANVNDVLSSLKSALLLTSNVEKVKLHLEAYINLGIDLIHLNDVLKEMGQFASEIMDRRRLRYDEETKWITSQKDKFKSERDRLNDDNRDKIDVFLSRLDLLHLKLRDCIGYYQIGDERQADDKQFYNNYSLLNGVIKRLLKLLTKMVNNKAIESITFQQSKQLVLDLMPENGEIKPERLVNRLREYGSLLNLSAEFIDDFGTSLEKTCKKFNQNTIIDSTLECFNTSLSTSTTVSCSPLSLSSSAMLSSTSAQQPVTLSGHPSSEALSPRLSSPRSSPRSSPESPGLSLSSSAKKIKRFFLVATHKTPSQEETNQTDTNDLQISRRRVTLPY